MLGGSRFLEVEIGEEIRVDFYGALDGLFDGSVDRDGGLVGVARVDGDFPGYLNHGVAWDARFEVPVCSSSSRANMLESDTDKG